MSLRILIAPDKFKGSISSNEICRLLKEELTKELPDAEIELCPLADGGDGSVEIIAHYLNLKKMDVTSVDPLGRSINSSYYRINKTAYIELANASGLVLLGDDEKNPMHTSTYGTGLQIRDAIEGGAKEIYLFLGGSATNDGGMGIATALGFEFLDGDGKILSPVGASLSSVSEIRYTNIDLTFERLILCCDVENPPFGPHGAAHIYARQKGANDEDIISLDSGLRNLCSTIQYYNGKDVSNLSGGGAAGGVAICLSGLMDGDIVSGMKLISQISNLESKIAVSDIVISGEGRLDEQSLSGKVISGVGEYCTKYGKKFWLVVGKNELSDEKLRELGVQELFSIFELADDLDDAITNSTEYLKIIGNRIAQRIINLE